MQNLNAVKIIFQWEGQVKTPHTKFKKNHTFKLPRNTSPEDGKLNSCENKIINLYALHRLWAVPF